MRTANVKASGQITIEQMDERVPNAVHEGSIILLVVLVAGLLGKNDLIALAALVMLTLQATAGEMTFAFLNRFGVQVGVIFLLIGLLLPFATGGVGFAGIRASLLSTTGLVAVVIGIVSAHLAAEGVGLLSLHPEVMVGLIVGSIIGVAWFKGIPAGPLVAAGIVSILYRLLRI